MVSLGLVYCRGDFASAPPEPDCAGLGAEGSTGLPAAGQIQLTGIKREALGSAGNLQSLLWQTWLTRGLFNCQGFGSRRKRASLESERDGHLVGSSRNSASSQTCFETRFCHSLAVKPRKDHLTALCLSFPHCKLGITGVLHGLHEIMRGPEVGLKITMASA